MAIDVDALKGRGRLFVDGFTPAQKALTALCVVAAVIAGVAFMKWTSTPVRRADGLAAQSSPSTVTGSPAVSAGAANGTGTQLAQTQAYDAALEQRIENMLDNTLGPGHAAVTVAAELDGAKRSSVTRRFNDNRPGTTVPITQNNNHETFGSNTGGTNGTPTTVYEKSQTQQRNAVDSTVTNSATPPGTLKRLSVSVLLDRAVVTPADIASVWRPSIAAAAGIDPKRDGNNALKVMTVAFSKSARKQQAQLAGTTKSNHLIDLGKQLLALLLLALVLFVAWQAMKRAERNRAARRVPLDLRELETVRAAGATLEPAAASARSGDAPVRTSLDASVAAIELEIADLIERQPDEVAQTLRSWLVDRRT